MSYDRSRLKQDLIRDEGLRLEAYKDSVGLWTIGVGHLLDSKPVDEPRIQRITNREAMALLDIDIEDAEHVLDQWIPLWANLDEVRQRALLNFCFNLGPRVLQFVNTRQYLLAHEWAHAAGNMLMSKWAKQVGSRSTRVTEMIRTGKDPV